MAVAYPHYADRRRRFKSILTTFMSFLASDEIGTLDIVGVETGYVNIFTLGNEIDDISQIGTLFPGINFAPNDQYISDMSAINANFSFKLSNDNGKMHISLQNAIAPLDGTSVLKLDIYGRWLSPQISIDEAFAWLDTAHDATVRTFSAITSEEIQNKIWEKFR